MKQRETINKEIDKEKEETKKARIGWDGKQYIVRFPSVISGMTAISTDDEIEFEVDYDTKELKLKLVKGVKK